MGKRKSRLNYYEESIFRGDPKNLLNTEKDRLG